MHMRRAIFSLEREGLLMNDGLGSEVSRRMRSRMDLERDSQHKQKTGEFCVGCGGEILLVEEKIPQENTVKVEWPFFPKPQYDTARRCFCGSCGLLYNPDIVLKAQK